jgi:hypothetical protein
MVELAIVGMVALLIHAFAFSASQLWVCPDTSYYIALAGGLAERFDFANELFLIRPPGYPVFLAGIFVIFGSVSPIAILVAQHGLVLGVTIITALIAWHLTQRRSMVILCGLFSAMSLQLLAFSNVLIAEAPYTFVLVLAVYFLVRYVREGERRFVAWASFGAGIACLIRPTGLSIVGICLLVAANRAWTRIRWREVEGTPFRLRKTEGRGKRTALSKAIKRPSRIPPWCRIVGMELGFALLPALIAVTPVTVLNAYHHGSGLTGNCASLALYHRLAAMDGLDAPQSAAFAEIRTVVEEAITREEIPAHANYRHWGPVWHAYEAVRDRSLVESAAIMGRANHDLIREHLGSVIKNTLRYAYWMVMVPDSFYRFQPGGAPGVQTSNGEYVREARAAIFDVSTYTKLMEPWVAPYAEYVTLQSAPAYASPAWRAIAEWFYVNIEAGPSIFGMVDSPYEEFGWLCIIGMIAVLGTRERFAWLVVAGVIFLQIVPSAFLAGPTPRYAIPIKPLMILYGAYVVVTVARTFGLTVQSAWFLCRRRLRAA